VTFPESVEVVSWALETKVNKIVATNKSKYFLMIFNFSKAKDQTIC